MKLRAWMLLLVVGCGKGADPAAPKPADEAAPLPALWKELPEGDIAGWYGKVEMKRMGQSRSDSLPAYHDADEYAVLHTETGFVQVLKGTFERAKHEAYFEKHCTRGTVDGEELWIPKSGREYSATYEAAHFTESRVIVGSKTLVLAALRVRAGKEKSFDGTVTAEERPAIRSTNWKDVLLLGRVKGESAKARDMFRFLGEPKDVEWMILSHEYSGGEAAFRSVAQFRSEEAARKCHAALEAKMKDAPDFVKIHRREVSGRQFRLEVSMPEDKAR